MTSSTAVPLNPSPPAPVWIHSGDGAVTDDFHHSMAPVFEYREEGTSLHERLRAIVEATQLGDLPPEVARLLEAIDGAFREKDAEAAALREELEDRPSILVEDPRAIAELRERTSQLEAIIESLPDSYARISADGVYLDFRRPKGRDFTVAVEQLRGRRYRETLPAEAAAAWDAAIAQAKATGKTTVFEFVLPTPNGRLNREARFTPYLDDQIIAVIRSTTKDKEMQAKLLVADRMASLGTLAAGVAHEINNPLAYAMNNLEAVALRRLPALIARLRDLGDDGADVAEELARAAVMIDVAREGCDRMRDIVRDLRTFTRGADEDRRVPVDLRRVLDASVNLAWNEIRHRARLVKEYGETPLVVANEARLGQVFLNLLVNAAQALQVGGAEDNVIRVITSSADGHVTVEVRDTGPGISAEHLARIFDPFFTTKPVGVGTGLGLWICQGIVSSLGGQISAENVPGGGAAFRVTLPANAGATGEAEAAAPAQPLPRTDAPRLRVLVGDDEAAIGRTLAIGLADEFDVTTATSGREGLELLSWSDRFDVVLCDLMMPDVSGMDLYDRVAGASARLRSRFVFVTGGAFTERARAFVQRGSAPVLEKPFDLTRLSAVLRDRGREPPR